jgi:hypothetical protein
LPVAGTTPLSATPAPNQPAAAPTNPFPRGVTGTPGPIGDAATTTVPLANPFSNYTASTGAPAS